MSGSRSRVFYPLILASAAVIFVSARGFAHHMVVRCNLEEMTQKADRIFLGRCVNVNETQRQIAGGLMPVTDYTFQVERVIKGKLPSEYTFTQLGHPQHLTKPKAGEVTMHGQVVTTATMLHGATSYQVGDEVMLFLVPNYLGGKITAPVGLYQGAFYRTTMPSGQELMRNQIDNAGLFTSPYVGSALTKDQARIVFPEEGQLANVRGVDTQALVQKRGALPVESIVTVVREINSAHGGQPGAIISTGKGVL
ncbi:MAG TPA: hypothetical protein VEZ90_19640 [Blastocatellia bacterium]|nr:hypothetical protein [Blastocatellia bacterium]